MSAPDDEDVVVPAQAEITVFWNKGGGITLKAVDGAGTEDLVAFPVAFAEAVIAGIRRAARGLESDCVVLRKAALAVTPNEAAKAVLVMLAGEVGDEHELDLTLTEMARRTGLAPAVVKSAVERFERNGWLETVNYGAPVRPWPAAQPERSMWLRLIPDAWETREPGQ